MYTRSTSLLSAISIFPPWGEYLLRQKVQHLFATSYEESNHLAQLTPRNGRGSATVANPRRDVKRVIMLLASLSFRALEEIDMVACHTSCRPYGAFQG